MNPQISELSSVSCWVQKKKRSLPSIFGESCVKKWLHVDPASRIIEYSDEMHGSTKLLGTFENVVGVKFDHKHKSNRALSITVRKKMPRQAQDAHETTLFVFEQDLSLSLVIHLFYSHPLRLLSEAEKTFLPKHIFDMLPKSPEPQKIMMQRVIKAADSSEVPLQNTKQSEAGYLGFGKTEAYGACTIAQTLRIRDNVTPSVICLADPPVSQSLLAADSIQRGESHPAVIPEIAAQQPRVRLPLRPRGLPDKTNRSSLEPGLAEPEPKIPSNPSLRLHLRLNTTREATNQFKQDPPVTNTARPAKSRVLQIRPPSKAAASRTLILALPPFTHRVSERAGNGPGDSDSDDSQSDSSEKPSPRRMPAASSRQDARPLARPAFKPITLALGTAALREQSLVLPKPLPLDKQSCPS